MRTNHKPCPKCSKEMHRQSKMCRGCYALHQSTPEVRAQMSAQRKGKPSYERTPKIRAKMSASQKGHSHSWQVGRKRPGINNRHWWTPERREEARQRGLLHAEDRAIMLKIANALAGENNPNYQGKNNATGYAPGWGRGYRRRLRARSNGYCEQCKRRGCRLDLHHRDFGKDNHDPSNIDVLCRSCHKILHFANSANT